MVDLLKVFLVQIEEIFLRHFLMLTYLFLFLVFSLIIYLIIRKGKKEKEELMKMLSISNAHTRMVVENSQNLNQFFEDLALIPVEMLEDQELADLVEKKLAISNHDIFRFLKINEFLSRLDPIKREIVFQLLVRYLLKRPSYSIGSLIFRSIVENEIEARNTLLDILKNSDSDTYRQDAYGDVIRYLKRYLKRENFKALKRGIFLSKSFRDKIDSEIKKIKQLM